MLPVSVSSPGKAPRSGGLSSIRTRNDGYRMLARKIWGKYGLIMSLFCAAVVWIWGTVRSHTVLVQETHRDHHLKLHKEGKMILPKRTYNPVDNVLHRPDEQPDMAVFERGWQLPSAFEPVLERAQSMQQECLSLSNRPLDMSTEMLVRNDTFASLPSLGIIETLQAWKATPDHPEADAMLIDVEDSANNWQCELPPEHECEETKVTVIFMAYNPDRLQKLLIQVKKFLYDEKWKTLIAEVVLTWNGPRPVEESPDGRNLLKLGETMPFRVVYPLRRGLENDLMNRYHPSVVRVEQTKAILYYDDDGPFYSFEAVQAGFELWKRHAQAQVGAMSRNFIDSDRQRAELKRLQTEQPNTPRDKLFVSHCSNTDDFVKYDYHFFANYDAHMALPSGSILHVNYLCFLWHPVLEPIRKFVRAHPVHPDDVTVSMIVSQISGRAPRVYSRRLNRPNVEDTAMYEEAMSKFQQKDHRRLDARDAAEEENEMEMYQGLIPNSELSRIRSLMFSIDWDAKHTNEEREDLKMYWAALREEAINSIVRYFGSITGGSIGWCENSPFYNPKVSGKCKPDMAKLGWLPWMDSVGRPKQTCP
uniref:Glycosyl transferase 64 domain-containing protein n=1 Tax=Amphora coffeiformis TaxID=265554 RepID=A0A7S3L6I8_9STRA